MAKVLNNQQLLDRRMKGLSFDGTMPALPAGIVRGAGSGTSDSNLAALSHEEYVLPEATTAAVGKENLDQLVRDTTGQEPGGKPVAPMKGLQGFAGGGMWDGVQLDPFEDQSLSKYTFDGSGNALDDSVSRQVSRSANGMLQSDEVWAGARPQLEDMMSRRHQGLMGFAGGGMIDNLYGETYDKRNALRGYTPEPGNIPERAPSRAAELRNYTPDRSRLAPTAQPAAPAGPAGIAPERAGRPYTPNFEMRGGASQPGTSLVPVRQPGGLNPTRPLSAADAAAYNASPEGRATAQQLHSEQLKARAANAGIGSKYTPPAAAPASPPPAAAATTPAAKPQGAARTGLGGWTGFAGLAGAAQSFDDLDTGYRDHFQKQMGVETPLGSVVADGARTLAAVGDAATFGVAGRVGRGIASATGGGSFADGFMSPSDREQFLAGKQTAPAQQPATPMTDRERADEIARRRAALEPQPARATQPALPNPYDRVVEDVNRVYDGRPRGLSTTPTAQPASPSTQAGEQAGAPAWLHAGSVQAESSGRRFGADGKILEGPQTKFGTAKGERQVLDSTNLDPGYGVTPARDDSPDERARVGRDYLDAMYQRYDGDPTAALAAYNWGPGNVDKWRASGADPSKLPAETQKYVQRILANQPTQLASADTGTMSDAPRGLSAEPQAPQPAAQGEEPFEMVPLRSLQGNIVGYDVVTGADNIRKRLAQEELRTAPGAVIAAGRGDDYLAARGQGAVNAASPLDATTDAKIREIGAEALFNPGGKGRGKGSGKDGDGSAKDDLQLYNETVKSVQGALGLTPDEAGQMEAERAVRRIQDERAILRGQLEQLKAAGRPYNEGMLEQLNGPLGEDERGMWTAALTAERQGQRGLATAKEYGATGAVGGGLAGVVAGMWQGAKKGASAPGDWRRRALGAAGGAALGGLAGYAAGSTNAPAGFEPENLRQFVVDEAGNPARTGHTADGNMVWETGGTMPDDTFYGRLGLQSWNPFFTPDPDALRAERIMRGGK